MNENDRSMTAIVEFQIRTETTSLDEWLDEWQKRADDAYLYEPETLAYEAAVNIDDESRVLIFERYQHGRSSLQKHMDRPAHALLQETMGARRMTKRRVMANLGADIKDYGWWSRPGTGSPQRTAGMPLTLLRMRFSELVQRDVFVELSQSHAKYCFVEEPETLVYSAAIALNETKPDAPIVRDDLMFVMTCTDVAAETKHALDPHHLALGTKLEERGLDLSGGIADQYRTTGRGYLWR